MDRARTSRPRVHGRSDPVRQTGARLQGAFGGTLVALAAVAGVLVGVRAIVSVVPGGVGSLLALAPLPRATFGVPWSSGAVWPASVQAHALTRMADVLAVLALTAASVAVLNALVLLAEAGASRSREMAVRAALGGSPWALAGGLFADVRVLFFAGGALGILLGLLAGAALRATWPGTLGSVVPVIATAETVVPLLCVGGLAAFVYVIAGLRGARTRSLAGALRVGGRTTDEGRAIALRRWLSEFQMAVAGSVLCATLVLAMAEAGVSRSVAAAPSDTSAVSVTVPGTASGTTWRTMLARLDRVPGMKAGSVATPGALVGLGVRDDVQVQCGACIIGLMYVPVRAARAVHAAVGPGFFAATGRRVVEGREFTSADGAGSTPVAVVNRAFADADFQNGEAIGHQIQVGTELKRWYRVVGIVDDAEPAAVGGSAGREPALWLSALQQPPKHAEVLLRGTPAAVRAGVAVLDAAGWVPGPPETLAEIHARAAAPLVWAGRVSLALAALTLLLAIYGTHVTSRQITRRATRALAMRRVVGATDGRLVRHALAGTLRGALWGAFGSLLGGTFLVGLIRLAASGVPAPPASVYLAVTTVLVASALAASWTAARDALRVEPAAVLE